MSTYPQYTLKSQDVYNFTINTLDTLPLHMPGVIQSRDLLRVLVCVAASKLAVHQACPQLERAPSGPTVRGTLAGSHRSARRACKQTRALRVRTQVIPFGRATVTEVNLSYPLSKAWGAAKSGRGKEINTPPTAFCLSLPCGTREAPLRMPKAVGK